MSGQISMRRWSAAAPGRGMRGTWVAVALLAAGWTMVPGPAEAATATVPGDYATIQEAIDAVQSDADPGEVIVESDAVFEEAVRIAESVTLRAGAGFAPVIERSSGFATPLEIRATEDSDTEVSVRGMTIRAIDGGGGTIPNQAVAISNPPLANNLEVTFEEVIVVAMGMQSGIAIASAIIAGNIAFELIDSSIDIVGEAAGGPECLRLDPFAYNLFATLINSHLRFSHADGVSVEGGRDDVLTRLIVDRVIFEGYETASGGPRAGVTVSGTGAAGNGDTASPTETAVFNSLFLRANPAIEVNGQLEHTHTLFANGNTLVDSEFAGMRFEAFGESTLQLSVFDNVIVGTRAEAIDEAGGGDPGGNGIRAEEFADSTVVLDNGYNLVFGSEGPDYFGLASPGPGAVSGNPRFTDPDADDYRLLPGSPAIDAGLNAPPGEFGGALDLGGDPRIQDGDRDGTATVDLGAFEAPPVDGVQVIPTLSGWTLGLLAAILVLAAAWRLRRSSGADLGAGALMALLAFALPAAPAVAHEAGSAAEAEGTPEVIAPDGGERLWIFPESKDHLGSGGELRIYIDAETHPDAAASFAKYTLGVGGSLPVHRHETTEEIAYIVSGEGVVVGYHDGERFETPVGEGYVWYTPPGAWHSFETRGDAPLVLVFAVVPNEEKGLLAFFRRIGASPGKEAEGALSPEEFGRLAAEHDLILRP